MAWAEALLVAQETLSGTARRHSLRADGVDRPTTVRIFGDEAIGDGWHGPFRLGRAECPV